MGMDPFEGVFISPGRNCLKGHELTVNPLAKLFKSRAAMAGAV